MRTRSRHDPVLFHVKRAVGRRDASRAAQSMRLYQPRVDGNAPEFRKDGRRVGPGGLHEMLVVAGETVGARAFGGIGPIPASGLSDLFKTWTGILADWVEIVAAIIIAIAVIEATIQAVGLFFRRNLPPEAKEFLRLRLGRWLALALEFELAADILRTAIAPSWSEIGLLAAVAAIRTALNYFLEKEIERGAKLRQAQEHGMPNPEDGRSLHVRSPFVWTPRRQPREMTSSKGEDGNNREPAPA